MRFDRFGLAFDYPENWSVDTGDAEGRFAAVTVYSPGGAFWSVSGHAPGGDSSRLAEAILLEMRREYRDLDSEAAVDEVGGRSLPGFDLNFYCLDLTNTAQIRTLETPGAIYLIHCQAEDREWETVQPVFAAMTASFVDGLARPGRPPRGDGRR
ncbi:MAG: hypothetical protein EBZ59_08510 [Planctomycetia bacterium]|nr:hypothetical protein [Planctomycetia bacterium]